MVNDSWRERANKVKILKILTILNLESCDSYGAENTYLLEALKTKTSENVLKGIKNTGEHIIVAEYRAI